MELRAPAYWQRRRGFALLLYPLSLLFALLVRLRRFGFRSGLKKTNTAMVPVIVVGNLTVGGAGKTPLVIALVKELEQAGWKPGVISRGYGGSESAPTLVDATADANSVGDEALMLSRRTGVPVAVCRNRFLAAERLTSSSGCNVIVSDDGLQHYALNRQVEICVIDGKTGLGNGWCLPAGPLREPPSRLREVDLIVYSGEEANEKGANQKTTTEKTTTENTAIGNVLRGVRKTNSDSCQPAALSSTAVSTLISRFLVYESSSHNPPQYDYTLQVEEVVNLQNPSMRKTLADFTGGPVHAVAAIGRPDKFFSQLRMAGLDIIEHPFADHHEFDESDLAFEDGKPVLMTEKDSVKCEKWSEGNFWVVKVVAVLDSGIVDAVLRRL